MHLFSYFIVLFFVQNSRIGNLFPILFFYAAGSLVKHVEVECFFFFLKLFYIFTKTSGSLQTLFTYTYTQTFHVDMYLTAYVSVLKRNEFSSYYVWVPQYYTSQFLHFFAINDFHTANALTPARRSGKKISCVN